MTTKKKIAIKKLFGEFRRNNYKDKFQCYKWSHVKGERSAYNYIIISYNLEKLKEEIKTKGLIRPIECVPVAEAKLEVLNILKQTTSEKHRYGDRYDYINIHDEFKYIVADGNHRVYAVRELYGEDYEIEIKPYKPFNNKKNK
jgi:hypothetical protein